MNIDLWMGQEQLSSLHTSLCAHQVQRALSKVCLRVTNSDNQLCSLRTRSLLVNGNPVTGKQADSGQHWPSACERWGSVYSFFVRPRCKPAV